MTMSTEPIEGSHRRPGSNDEYSYEGGVEVMGDVATWRVSIELNGQVWHRSGTVYWLRGAEKPCLSAAVQEAISRAIDSLG
jgi:hypothetical protein